MCDGADARLLALDDPVRRRSLHPGEESRNGAVSPDSYAVSRRLAVAGALPGWDGGSYWGHVGYPSDLAGGQQPAFIGYQPFIDTETESTGGRNSYLIDHDIDVIPGQSGGPYFGWWGSEPWPRVVAIQSGQQHGSPTGPNDCGGGNPLPDLISYALAQAP